MKLHNTLTRSVDQFQPQNDNQVSFYSCGPTVYDKQTIGNYAAYIRWDILARSLKQNYDLNWYMNITDVGHLVSDADEGEDKLEKGAKREGKTAWQVAEFYTEDFIEGLNKLNISIPKEHLVKATDHIPEQIALIKTLEEKGYIYTIDDGVYFDSTKFSDYGKMARLDIKGLQAGARVDIGQKKNPTDFVVWKLTPTDQNRDMEWDSPWGKGFPGWHIECSAMAMKYLGETIDIHSGGIDHIPVHHTNEIAQSEAATGKQFVRYWLHSNFLQVNGTKIAKSLGNGYTLDDLEKEGYDAMSFRMFVVQSHYRTESNFTWDGLDGARTRLHDLRKVADLRFQPIEHIAEQTSLLNSTKTNIIKALEDDLNTPQALSSLSVLANELENNGLSASNVKSFNEFLAWLDNILGFNLLKSTDINDEIKNLISSRQEARDSKDWATSDNLREELTNKGIGINDTASGARWFYL